MSVICQELHELLGSLPRHAFPFSPSDMPQNGLYVLFELGETGHGGDRIVRVGTHTGVHQLRSRLQQHFMRANKDRSIFRKNIGRALLNRDNDPFLEFWELDRTSRKAKERHAGFVDLARQAEIEQRVTQTIQEKFSFVVLAVEDKGERLRLESRLVSTVSLCSECVPSDNWLGLHSPKSKIRDSGLWLVNELYKTPLSAADLDTLRVRVEKMNST